MASSLGAAIQARFGIAANLVEGHDGIYEVIVNGNVIYTNQSTCSNGFPADDVIFQEIRQYQELLPDFVETTGADEQDLDAPACSWSPPVAKVEPESTGCGCSSEAKQETEPSSCGCSPTAPLSYTTNGSSCCTPPVSNVSFGDEPVSSSCCG